PRPRHAGRPYLPRDHLRFGTHAVVRVATVGHRSVADRRARADAAAPGGAPMIAERFVLAPSARTVARAAAAVGGVAVAVGLAVDPDRTWPNLLMDGFFAVALALAGLVSIALQFLSGASWNAKIRRIPEALMAPLPAAGAVMLLLFFGRERLYPWSR